MSAMRNFTHRSGVVLLTAGFISFACAPPPQQSEIPAAQEPPPEGGIPWAAGEAPADGEASTREVSAEPTVEERPEEFFAPDGVEQTGAAAACSGRATPALRADVDVRSKETRACYDKVPLEKAGAAGEIKVSLRVGQSGKVENLEVLSDSLEVPEVTNCVKEVLMKPFTASRPSGGCAVFLIPIHLKSEKVEEPATESAASELPK